MDNPADISNPVLIQFFHWYYSPKGKLWNDFSDKIPELHQLGISMVWLPPAYKGRTGKESVGYDAYDLYDLGEFDQKGSIETKYGNKEELLNAIKLAHKHGIKVIMDTVFNHKAGADETETVKAIKVDPNDRRKILSNPFEIKAWTKFTFPGRNGKYSDFVWDYKCFSGVDWNEESQQTGIFKILNEYGEKWESIIVKERGNYDYLMFSDIEFRNEAVRDEIKHWGEWFFSKTQIDGFRLDAVKHITPYFFLDWIEHMHNYTQKPLAMIGEFWENDINSILECIETTRAKMCFFDAPLHNNFYQASIKGNQFDMRCIFNNTLVQQRPDLAVTLVDNHDTQPLQALESPIEIWFQPLAYSMILLRKDGLPCVFHPALYGTTYVDKGHDGKIYNITLPKVDELPLLLQARQQFAYGDQCDYLDHPNTIAWARLGNDEISGSGCVVILTNGNVGYKDIKMGSKFANRTFYDFLNHRNEEITTDSNGCTRFWCNAGSVSVWVLKQ